MRNLTIALVVGLASMLAVTDAMAQGRGGGRFGRGGGPGGPGGDVSLTQLLGVEKVAEAIKLTDDQQAQVREMQRELRGDRGDRPNFRDMSEADRAAAREERAKQRAERQKQEAEKLGAILDEGQMKRLKEIKVQVQGPGALLDPDVQSELGLSSATVTELQKTAETAQQEMRDQMRELFQSGDRDSFREKMTEMRDAMQKKLLGVLSESEKEQFTAMQGEKLDVSPQDLFGGRGRGGPGGPGGGQGDRGGRNRDGGGGAGRPELE